jgi:hypothetical protein
MKTLLALSAILMLSGCANLKGMFANRAACTLDGKQMLVASMYGPIGIASKIDDADGAVVCAPAAASAPK